MAAQNTPRTASLFLLTPLREGRHDQKMLEMYGYIISTHAPAGGATKPEDATSSPATNFYSPPCGRGDGRRHARSAPAGAISTHAPAGGATPLQD